MVLYLKLSAAWRPDPCISTLTSRELERVFSHRLLFAHLWAGGRRGKGLADDARNRNIGVLLEDGGDGIDVGLVLVDTVVGDGVLAVGGQSCTITVGKVVDYEGANDGRRGASGVLRLNVGQVGVHGGNLGGVAVCCQLERLRTAKWVTYSHT